jgi:hypothetical protein
MIDIQLDKTYEQGTDVLLECTAVDVSVCIPPEDDP